MPPKPEAKRFPTAAGRPKREPIDSRMAHRVLEELIYERVRVTVDLIDLTSFERDLSTSIERALLACEESPTRRADLAFDYLAKAWERVSDEVLGTVAQHELPP